MENRQSDEPTSAPPAADASTVIGSSEFIVMDGSDSDDSTGGNVRKRHSTGRHKVRAVSIDVNEVSARAMAWFDAFTFGMHCISDVMLAIDLCMAIVAFSLLPRGAMSMETSIRPILAAIAFSLSFFCLGAVSVLIHVVAWVAKRNNGILLRRSRAPAVDMTKIQVPPAPEMVKPPTVVQISEADASQPSLPATEKSPISAPDSVSLLPRVADGRREVIIDVGSNMWGAAVDIFTHFVWAYSGATISLSVMSMIP